MDEETLDKLIRQSCNEIAEEECRELAHIGEGQEYVPSKRLQRKMRRLLRYHKINNAGYPGAQPKEKTDDTIEAKIAEKTEEKTSKGRNKILHPIYWSKRTAVALLAVVVMAFGAMVTFGAKDIDSWLDELSFEYNDGYVTIEQNGWTFTSPSKFVKAELTYVPEGYEPGEEYMSEKAGSYTRYYEAADETIILFKQLAAGSVKIDLSANNQPKEDVIVNRYGGYYIPNDEGWGSIVFCDESYLYMVYGRFEKEELLEIAKGIKVVEKK